jgi:hypothetical protein
MGPNRDIGTSDAAVDTASHSRSLASASKRSSESGSAVVVEGIDVAVEVEVGSADIIVIRSGRGLKP